MPIVYFNNSQKGIEILKLEKFSLDIMPNQDPIQEKANEGPAPKGGLKNWLHHINLLTPSLTLVLGVIGTIIAINGIAPDFHITVNPMSGEITPGGIAKSTVFIDEKYDWIFNYKDPIYLSADGLPPNADAIFAGIPRGANFESSMNILTKSNVTPGRYEITIKATGCDGLEHIGKFFLIIDDPKK